MTIELNDPELERLIADHIQSGRFATPLEAVTAALASMELDRPGSDDEIDPMIAARLREAYERGRHGDPGHTIEQARELLLGKPVRS